MREQELLQPVATYVNDLGLEFFCEVPFDTRRIDVVGWSWNRLVCIELKVRDWKKAILQASICQLCTPEVYVALPYGLARKVDEHPFSEMGIGLLSVDGSTKVLLEPKDLGLTDPRLRERMELQLRRDGM